MPEGPSAKNEGRYGTSLKVLGFSHSQKDLDGGGPNAQWSASRGRSSQLGPHCTLEPSEALLHPLSTLHRHSKPEWVLFQPQDGAVSLRARGRPGQVARLSHRDLSLGGCRLWRYFHTQCENSDTGTALQAAASSAFQNIFFSLLLESCAQWVCRALHPAPRSRVCALAGSQSCWLAGWMDRWILVEGLIYTKLVESHRSAH